MALLAILARLGYDCIAAHVNFHLRGAESDRDERFSGQWAATLNNPFHQTSFDTAAHAAAKGISIEMAARELRYAWFEELRRQCGAQAIAVAHHRDDQVETVLLNLLRGTGIRGLRGMRPRNGYIVRPLLFLPRSEILTWLEKEGLTYVTDSTNLSDQYTRNFIRLQLLPLMEQANPSAKEAIARTAGHLSDAERIYDAVVEDARQTLLAGGDRLPIDKLMDYPAPQTILYELLLPYHFSRSVAEEVFTALGKEPGKQFYSPTHRLVKDRNELILSPIHTKETASCQIDTPEGHSHSPVELSWRVIDRADLSGLGKDPSVAYFDLDKLTFPLHIRPWQAGDWFIPFGMKGRRKLSDYFTGRKYSLPEKENAWLLCQGNDIVWIIGERTDDRYKIDGHTKKILIMNFFGKTR